MMLNHVFVMTSPNHNRPRRPPGSLFRYRPLAYLSYRMVPKPAASGLGNPSDQYLIAKHVSKSSERPRNFRRRSIGEAPGRSRDTRENREEACPNRGTEDVCHKDEETQIDSREDRDNLLRFSTGSLFHMPTCSIPSSSQCGSASISSSPRSVQSCS
jgi:hypothetical protein